MVIEQNSYDSFLDLGKGNLPLTSLTSLNLLDNSLETQVNILRSPSVLKPVFEFARESKESSGQNIKEFYFEEWRDDFLDAELEKGTSVVSISYRDPDPNLALKAAGLMSLTYQKYSNRDNIDAIDRSVDYLSSQVDIYRQIAKNSLKNVETFRLKNNLGITDGVYPNFNSQGVMENDSVESQRIQLQYRADSLASLIEAVKEAGSSVVYQAPQVNINESIYRDLQSLESELAFKASLLKDDDELIVRLKRRKATLISYINTQTIGLLKGQLTSTLSRLESFKRDPKVLINYRILMAESLRDQKTLESLEQNYQFAKLSQAKQLVPWELITEPTISTDPVSPTRLQMIFIVFLFGNLLALIISLIKLNQSGEIVDFEEFNSLLKYKFLGNINSNKKSYLNKILIPKSNLSSSDKSKRKVNILTSGKSVKSDLDKFLKLFKDLNQDINFSIIDSINELEISNEVILLLHVGKTTYEDIDI